jgi:hypothetical protein
MRHAPRRAKLAAMKLVTRTQRVILDAATKASVIRGTLTAPSGARRDFHGWLQPTQRGTLFRFRVYEQSTGVMRLAEPILSRILKRRFAGYWTTLKSVLENASPPGMTRVRRSRLQA